MCTEYRSISSDLTSVTSSPHMNHIKKQDVACHTQTESHAAALAHMLASPLQCVLFLKPALAQFLTPIDVLLENNGPKSVVIPKVVTFGAIKINFLFLHSV